MKSQGGDPLYPQGVGRATGIEYLHVGDNMMDKNGPTVAKGWVYADMGTQWSCVLAHRLILYVGQNKYLLGPFFQT